MSLVKIVEVEDYSKENINNGLKDLFEVINLEDIKDKNITVFFDFPMPDMGLMFNIYSFLVENGAKEVSFGTSLMLKEEGLEFIEECKKRNIKFHNFREEPYEEFDVDLKAVKHSHYLGYQILSPGQYQQEKAFEQTDFFKVRTLKKVYVPLALSSADYIVPIIKLKDSPVSKIGGFMNSLLYIVPTNIRSEIFLKVFSLKFADALLDVFGVIKNTVLLGIVDGIQADLTKDEENDYKILMSSTDLLALDSNIAVLIGFRSSDIETNKVGSTLSLGYGLFKDVVVEGPDFIKIRKEITNKLKFKKAMDKRTQPEIIRIDEKINEVENLCPTGAIEKRNNGYSIDRHKCIKCNFCIEIAPNEFNVR
jgi:NAD-dependent dihydropyrimidine dehydrogenase PreA subunit